MVEIFMAFNNHFFLNTNPLFWYEQGFCIFLFFAVLDHQ